jgi:tetratricopeptide (TPR) repeat protein
VASGRRRWPDEPGLLVERGLAYHALGQNDRAEADLARVVALAPDDAEARRELAVVVGHRGRWKEALGHLARGIEQAPRDALMRTWLGYAHLQLGAPGKALAELNQAVELAPNDPLPRQFRGDVLCARGREKQADVDYARAIELGSSSLWVWYLRACALLERGDADAYRRLCRTMYDRCDGKEDPTTAHYTARACLLAPRPPVDSSTLLRLAEKALAAYPDQAGYRFVLALAHYRAGQFEEALRQAQQAADARPDPMHLGVQCRLVLALASHRLGRAEDARRRLAEARRQMSDTGEILAPQAGTTASHPRLLRRERRLLLREAEALLLTASGRDRTG